MRVADRFGDLEEDRDGRVRARPGDLLGETCVRSNLGDLVAGLVVAFIARSSGGARPPLVAPLRTRRVQFGSCDWAFCRDRRGSFLVKSAPELRTGAGNAFTLNPNGITGIRHFFAMVNTFETHVWQPVAKAEHYPALDALRGLALLGVLMVNVHGDFRISLAQHILTFHTGPDSADCATDILVSALLEFKAFALFFCYSESVSPSLPSVPPPRHRRHALSRPPTLSLVRTWSFLLIWNGDILTLYAVCGGFAPSLPSIAGRGVASTGGSWSFHVRYPLGVSVADRRSAAHLGHGGDEGLLGRQLRRCCGVPLVGDTAAHPTAAHFLSAENLGIDGARRGSFARRG